MKGSICGKMQNVASGERRLKNQSSIFLIRIHSSLQTIRLTVSFNLLFIFSFFHIGIQAQDVCQQAIDIGLGNCISLSNQNATADDGTGEFCSTYENNMWYFFTATARVTEVTVIPTACFGDVALEMEIFQVFGCTDFLTPLACGATMATSALSFTIMTTPGEIYYIIIDGVPGGSGPTIGSYCEYKLNLVHGICPNSPSACDSIEAPIIEGVDSICFGHGIYVYEIRNFDPTLSYYWAIPELASYTNIGENKIEINWRNYEGNGDPMVCVTAVNDECVYAKTCLNIHNESLGDPLDPQIIGLCPEHFPLDLDNYYTSLFFPDSDLTPPGLVYHLYLSKDDLLNDINEVFSLDTAGDYTIFVALSLNDCIKIPFPIDSAQIYTEFVELNVTTEKLCEGEKFKLKQHVHVNEIHGYPGRLTDPLHFYTSAEDAVNRVNIVGQPFEVYENSEFWVRFYTENGCSDTASFKVEFHEIPEFTAESPDTMCSVLGDATYNLLSTTFNFTIGNESEMTFSFYRNEQNAINDINEIAPIVITSRTFYVVATSPFGCRSDPVPIDVLFLKSPFIQLFGGGGEKLCKGDSGEIVIVAINTPIPFTIVLEDDFGNRDTIVSFESSFFYHLPIFESTKYHLVSFETHNPVFCPLEYEEDINFNIIRLPSATLEVATGCGPESGVYFRSSQNGEYTVHLRNIITGTTYVFSGELNNELLSIPLLNGDRIVLDSFQYDDNCWSFIADTTEAILLQEPLEVNNISIGACDPSQSVISFTISGGDIDSYRVLGLQGTIQSNMIDFISEPHPTGTYSILITDDRACDTVTLNIMIDCGCQTEPGTILASDTVLCEDELFSIAAVGDTHLISGDMLQFFLHDQPPPVYGNIIQSNTTGDFNFDQSLMSFGEIYMVTMWAGQAINGEVDTSALCTFPSNTVRMKWVEIPHVSIFDTLGLCEAPVDTSVIINFSGDGPYTFSYVVNGATFGPITTNLNNFTLPLNGLFQSDILSITTFSNEACDGVVDGLGQIAFIEHPELKNLVYTCNSSKDSFSFEVDIMGGNLPYIVSGLSGQLIGNTFFSDTQASGYIGKLYLEDANACEIIELPIFRDCECESSSGILPGDDLILCADSVVVLPFVVNPIIALGDGQKFLIKDNSLPDTTGILAILDNAVIEFAPGYMVYGQTYYIVPATSQLDINGDLILDSKCFSTSNVVSFVFYEIPQISVTLTSDTLTCINQEILIDASASIVPLGYQFEWMVISGHIVSGEQTLTPIVGQEGRYVLRIFNTLVSCSAEKEIDIFINEDQARALVLADTLLNCAFNSIIIDGSNSDAGNQFSFEWQTTTGHFNSAVTELIVEVDKSGTYSLTVQNNISGCRDTAEVTILEDFTTPDASIKSSADELTCLVPTIQLINTSTLSTNDEVHWFSAKPYTQISMQEIELKDPGKYYVVVKNELSQCSDTAEVSIDEDVQFPILEMDSIYFVDCIDNVADLHVDIMNAGAATYSYAWTSVGSTIIGDPSANQVKADMEGTFTVVVTNVDNGCKSQISTEVIALQEPINSIELYIVPSACGTNDQGELRLENINGGTGPFLIELNGVEYNNLPLVVDDLAAGEHNLTITDANLCTLDTIITIRNLIDVSLSLPNTINVEEGNSVHIIPDIVGPVDTFLWIMNDTMPLSLANLDPTLFPENDFVLRLVLISPDSCVAEDEIQIIVRLFYNIYIPTAFSPNNDGVNDRLVIFGPNKLSSVESFQIFNRWGGKVYEAYDFIPNEKQFGWDGTTKDRDASTGTYVYRLEAIFKDGTTKRVSGEFTLVR